MDILLSNSELVGNSVQSLADLEYGSDLQLDLCTVAEIGAINAPMFNVGAGLLGLNRSIIWQPGRAITYAQAATRAIALGGAYDGHELPEDIHAVTRAAVREAELRALLRACTQALEDADTRAVVITHGTDTLEETAWLLHSLLPATKPIVLTCAMRPATALLADGPQNLRDAVTVAAVAATSGVRRHTPQSGKRTAPVAFSQTWR